MGLVDHGQRIRALEDKVERLERTVARLLAAWNLPEHVTLSAMPSNQGWVLTFSLPEAGYDVEAVLGEAAPIRLETGLPPDRPVTTAWTTIAHARAKTMSIALRWRSVEDDSIRGPFHVTFDPFTEVVTSTKRFLAAIPHWIAFSTKYDGELKVYFTHLLCYKNALRAIRVWVDDHEAEPVAFAPADTMGIGNDDECYRVLPNYTQSVSVEVCFLDGSTSSQRVFVTEASDA